ncbi:hypothetical protein ACPPVQ_05970 [Diaminobutyricibacter sp. McL0618]|uniref:hypothetical protein n=1 Tax=Leifsonia sp. McL0618 TaxID=3415677 RepID=UPI003CE732B7
MTSFEPAPDSAWVAAADWIAERHEWLRQLVARIVLGGTSADDWLDQLVDAVIGFEEHELAWLEYERQHPAPRPESQYDAWFAAGPVATPGVQAFGLMSSGEKNLIRLVATLGGRVPWSVRDVSFDQRGAALLSDWLAAVHAQLPR